MEREGTNDYRKGVACLVASALGFALMGFFVRLCDDYGAPVSPFQKSFFRNAIAVVIAAALFARTRMGAKRQRCESPVGRDSAVRSASRATTLPLLLLRSLFGTVGIFANFYALSHIPIGEAMTLNKTAPFFTVLFSFLLLGERLTARRVGCLVVAFAGAVLVMKPGFRDFGNFAAACGLFGGLCAGLAYTFVRWLGVLGVEGAFIVLFFSAFSTVASLPFMLVGFAPMTAAQVLIMVGAGAGAAVGQFGVTAAYRYAPPGRIAVYDYTNIVFASLLGFVFLDQTPDVFAVAGFGLILLAAFASRR